MSYWKGELSDKRNKILPGVGAIGGIGAIGGMVFPGLNLSLLQR